VNYYLSAISVTSLKFHHISRSRASKTA